MADVGAGTVDDGQAGGDGDRVIALGRFGGAVVGEADAAVRTAHDVTARRTLHECRVPASIEQQDALLAARQPRQRDREQDLDQDAGAEDTPVAVSGEVLEDFLAGSESGANEERDNCTRVREYARERCLLACGQMRLRGRCVCHIYFLRSGDLSIAHRTIWQEL